MKAMRDLPTVRRFVTLLLLFAWAMFCFGLVVGFAVGLSA
jgi:hypothetical protein